MESTTYTVGGKEFELQHHGVKGMKWGVRRYQKKDGSLTPAGKKRNKDGENPDSAKNKKIAKRVVAAVAMTATVSTAAVLYAKNRKAVNQVIAKVGKSTIEGFKKTGPKIAEAGKKYVKEAYAGAKQGVKEGLKEGVREAPKKAVKAVMTGATLMAAKRMLDASIGKEEAARIFQANNNKKISSFWKVNDPEDKDDD